MTQKHKDFWKCVSCKSKIPKKDNTNTPIRSDTGNVTQRRGGGISTPESSPASTHEEDTATSNETLLIEMRLFRKEMQETRARIEVFNETINKLNLRMDICEDRMEKLIARVEKIENRVDTDTTTQSNTTLSESIEQLKAELNERDQDLLLNDLQISCIPEQNNENVTHVVMNVAAKLGVQLADQDIVSAIRIGSLSKPDESDKKNRRPRLMVVRLARRVLRDQLLQAARVRRGATTEGMDLPGPPRKFYINERLTLKNRQLFQKAREMGIRNNWRYIWTAAGKIFVRQRQGKDEPRFRLRTESDLIRVFGSEAIGS
ncbi:uncharacterized protein LOC131842824 [Achroia grisella]|uniref:uncharacterized protein LOC131842824 n=1 Tax=Achroia grisella TaxID=688607 RepID=UPI0027D28BE5|nr:uncharacterized protein LOC131842824 [Achroia grisella]